jgi:hypothetical protein
MELFAGCDLDGHMGKALVDDENNPKFMFSSKYTS